MNPWLHQQVFASRLHDLRDLSDEGPGIGYLVNHEEGQSEVTLFRNTNGARTAQMGPDPVEHACLLCPLPEDLEHLLLKIRRNDMTGFSNQLCHGNGKKTHTAANINGRHAVFQVGADDFFRPVDESSKGIVKGVGKPPGADVFQPQWVFRSAFHGQPFCSIPFCFYIPSPDPPSGMEKA